MRDRIRARPLTVHIVGLALAMTLPPLLLAAATAALWVRSEQAQLRENLLAKAAFAQELVERYSGGKIAMLQALATSPSLDTIDLTGLDRQMRTLAAQQGINLVLRDRAGQQLINSRLPPRSALPMIVTGEAEERAAATGQPVVMDMTTGNSSGLPLVRILMPVVRHGETNVMLVAGLPPYLFQQVLQQAGFPPGYSASLTDTSGTIIARADGRIDLVGKPLPGFAQTVGASGTWSGINPNGHHVFGSYYRSSASGWMMAVGVDHDTLNAPLYRSLWMIGGLALLLCAIAVAASVVMARKIVLSLREVASAAKLLGEGRFVEAIHTPLREANEIGGEISTASSKLLEGATALAAANRDLEHRVEARTREARAQAAVVQATVDNMDQGLMLIERGADGRVPIWNRRAIELLGLPDSLFATPPLFADIIRHQLQGDDFAKSGEILRQWVEQGGIEPNHHTYERERPNGTVLEIRTVPLPDGRVVRTYTDVTERKRAERLSDHLAHHDPLTGLPNRRLFHERLAETIATARQDGTTFAAFYLDLDRFKTINDTLGHAAGDALLCEVATRIRTTAGPNDIAARLAGDEFAVIQVDHDQPAAAERLARALNAAMNRPVELDGEAFKIGVSIGVATGCGEEDADTLFGQADAALYRAKREGRNAYRFHDASLGIEPGERQLLEFDMQGALARGEFELRYQPVISVADGRVVSFEALLRWRHPERGMVPPVEFIALAEETRLIVPIGAWALNEACRAAAAWPGELSIAVNISAVQIEHDELFATVLSALALSGLPARRLELEITESVLARGNGTVLNSLRLLRGIGVRIALDDFGTGYSSLSYLQSFPLDRIKVDRSFTASADERSTAAIIRAIVGLGLELGMAVTAEGVETDEQLETVRRHGCTDVQGYLFSPPVPLADATAMLDVEWRRVA